MQARVVWATGKKYIFKFNMFLLNFLPHLGCFMKEGDFIILTLPVFYLMLMM